MKNLTQYITEFININNIRKISFEFISLKNLQVGDSIYISFWDTDDIFETKITKFEYEDKYNPKIELSWKPIDLTSINNNYKRRYSDVGKWVVLTYEECNKYLTSLEESNHTIICTNYQILAEFNNSEEKKDIIKNNLESKRASRADACDKFIQKIRK